MKSQNDKFFLVELSRSRPKNNNCKLYNNKLGLSTHNYLNALYIPILLQV